MAVSFGTINWLGLVLVGSALLWALRAVSAAGARASALLAMLQMAAWVMILMGAVGSVVAFVPADRMVPTVVVLVIGMIPLSLLAAVVLNRYRDTETRGLIWLIGTTLELNLPLATVTRGFADGRHDDLGRRTEVLARLLERGTPLDRALSGARLRVPNDLRLAARLQPHGLRPAMAHLAGREDPETVRPRGLLLRLLYVFIVTNVLIGVQTYMAIRIVPTFGQVFADFGMPVPDSMAYAAPLSIVSDPRFGWLYIAVGILQLLTWIALAIGLAYYVGWLRYEIPLVRPWRRPIHGANVLRTLAVNVESGESLPKMLAALAEAYPVGHIARRLQRVSGHVTGGGDWIEALQKEKLIRPRIAQILRSAERAGNLKWALDESANIVVRRCMDRDRVMMDLTIAFVVLLFAVPVGLSAVAVLGPLSQLVQSLA